VEQLERLSDWQPGNKVNPTIVGWYHVMFNNPYLNYRTYWSYWNGKVWLTPYPDLPMDKTPTIDPLELEPNYFDPGPYHQWRGLI
jgi:hypothetical protein